MNEFTYEEMFLVEAYGGGTRTGTIEALSAMRGDDGFHDPETIRDF